MNFSYEELENELLKTMKALAPDFNEEWMPYLIADLLDGGVFGTQEDE